MHGASIDSRNGDAMTLLNYAFANFSLCPLAPEGELSPLPVEVGGEDRLPLGMDGPYFALVPKGGGEVSYELDLPEALSAPIREGEVLCRTPDGTRALPADTVVLAVGDKPDKTLYESVKDLVPECYLVGDAAGGGIIPNAVFDGYTVGAKL